MPMTPQNQNDPAPSAPSVLLEAEATARAAVAEQCRCERWRLLGEGAQIEDAMEELDRAMQALDPTWQELFTAITGVQEAEARGEPVDWAQHAHLLVHLLSYAGRVQQIGLENRTLARAFMQKAVGALDLAIGEVEARAEALNAQRAAQLARASGTSSSAPRV